MRPFVEKSIYSDVNTETLKRSFEIQYPRSKDIRIPLELLSRTYLHKYIDGSTKQPNSFYVSNKEAFAIAKTAIKDHPDDPFLKHFRIDEIVRTKLDQEPPITLLLQNMPTTEQSPLYNLTALYLIDCYMDNYRGKEEKKKMIRRVEASAWMAKLLTVQDSIASKRFLNYGFIAIDENFSYKGEQDQGAGLAVNLCLILSVISKIPFTYSLGHAALIKKADPKIQAMLKAIEDQSMEQRRDFNNPAIRSVIATILQDHPQMFVDFMNYSQTHQLIDDSSCENYLLIADDLLHRQAKTHKQSIDVRYGLMKFYLHTYQYAKAQPIFDELKSIAHCIELKEILSVPDQQIRDIYLSERFKVLAKSNYIEEAARHLKFIKDVSLIDKHAFEFFQHQDVVGNYDLIPLRTRIAEQVIANQANPEMRALAKKELDQLQTPAFLMKAALRKIASQVNNHTHEIRDYRNQHQIRTWISDTFYSVIGRESEYEKYKSFLQTLQLLVNDPIITSGSKSNNHEAINLAQKIIELFKMMPFGAKKPAIVIESLKILSQVADEIESLPEVAVRNTDEVVTSIAAPTYHPVILPPSAPLMNVINANKFTTAPSTVVKDDVKEQVDEVKERKDEGKTSTCYMQRYLLPNLLHADSVADGTVIVVETTGDAEKQSAVAQSTVIDPIQNRIEEAHQQELLQIISSFTAIPKQQYAKPNENLIQFDTEEKVVKTPVFEKKNADHAEQSVSSPKPAKLASNDLFQNVKKKEEAHQRESTQHETKAKTKRAVLG